MDRQGFCSQMTWVAMSSAGAGQKSKVSVAIYQEILECIMLLAADKLNEDADFLIQQDFAPAHPQYFTLRIMNIEYMKDF